MMQPDCIEIVCVTDANYAPHLTALLKSIETNKGSELVRVHAICDGVESGLINRIRSVVPNLIVVDYHVVGHVALALPPIMHISRATYLRLIMPEILPADVKRIIYLDIDMVVTQSLLPLWKSSLNGRVLAAVEDHNISAKNFADRFGLSPSGRYFNAGMLLINMQAERSSGYLAHALERLTANSNAYTFADQDALNEVLWDGWTKLEDNWNYQRAFVNDGNLYRSIDQNCGSLPSIIHFTEEWKPWKPNEWHPYAWLYWRNLRRTPFADEVQRLYGVSPLHLVKFWLKFQLASLRTKFKV